MLQNTGYNFAFDLHSLHEKDRSREDFETDKPKL